MTGAQADTDREWAVNIRDRIHHEPMPSMPYEVNLVDVQAFEVSDVLNFWCQFRGRRSLGNPRYPMFDDAVRFDLGRQP